MSTTEPTDASKSCFEDFQKALDDAKRPFCSGTLAIDESNLLLFYGNSKGQAARIDFANASDIELQRLAEACDLATLRSRNEEILDESYGKAGKLEEKHFATNFDVYSTGLMDVIRFGLLEGSSGAKTFRAEPYKLYVYDKGSFLTAHNYSRTGRKAFGSLVIVFPTTHEGGSLLLRRGRKEWVVDSGRLVAEMRNDDPEQPHIVFVTSLGDVEHEVTPVKSGYRVTLVYNLYYQENYIPAIECPLQAAGRTIPPTSALKMALSNLIQEPTFLPEGGGIGFGLYHQYPLDEFKDDIRDLRDYLKGRDAMILKVCKELSLEVDIWLLYDDERCEEVQFLAEAVLELNDIEDSPYLEWMLSQPLGHCVRAVERYEGAGAHLDIECDSIVWARMVSDLNEISDRYITYFNGPDVDEARANVCLVVLRDTEAGPRFERASIGDIDARNPGGDSRQISSGVESLLYHTQKYERPDRKSNPRCVEVPQLNWLYCCTETISRL